MSAAAKADLGGRPVNLQKLAKTLVRRRGAAWIAEAARQADLGEVAAMRFLVDLSGVARPKPIDGA